MSEPILPLRQWPAGIQQASVPANDNALRVEALSRPCLGVANDASGTDADGDVWIVDSAPTGAFAGFDPNDLALYHVDPDTSTPGWYPWAPTDGLRLIVAGVPMIYVGGSTNEWQNDTSDGIPDAPSDGTGYVRKDGAWAAESGGGTGIVESIVAGANVTVDSTDPANPIVSATGGGGGSGDVVGPASSTAGNLALFDGTSGKLLKDGGTPASRSPNIQSVTSASTVTPTFSNDMVRITAQAAALALANPTGTAIPGLGMVIRIKDDGTARSIAYGTQYRAMGVALPTTTVADKTLYLAMIYNDTDTAWDVIAVGQQA